jgi:phosphate transport system protein
MELAIDEQCIRILALYQPAASDLRFIAAALKIVTDLERIGDLAVNMAERAECSRRQVGPPAVGELPAAATAARRCSRTCSKPSLRATPPRPQVSMRADADIDVRTARVIAEVQGEMQRDPRPSARGVATIFFAKHIERMADHATNIAEMVVYLVRDRTSGTRRRPDRNQRTTSTGRVERRTTSSATDPSSARASPPRPCEARLIASTLRRSAACRMVSAGLPPSMTETCVVMPSFSASGGNERAQLLQERRAAAAVRRCGSSYA